MARKLIEFPLFDIKEIYREIKEKGITPFKWVTEEIEKTFPEEIIKELKPIRRKLLPLPEEVEIEEELPPELISRTIYATVGMKCCYHDTDEIVHDPPDFEVPFTETQTEFTDSFEEWIERITPEFMAEMKSNAEAECAAIATIATDIKLCPKGFTFKIIEGSGIEEPASEEDREYYNKNVNEGR